MGCGGDRQLAVGDDLDAVAGAQRGAPHHQGGRSLGTLQRPRDGGSLGGVVHRGRDADRIAWRDNALADDPRVHSAIRWMPGDAQPSEAQVAERVADRPARVRGTGELDDDLRADCQPRPDGQRRHVEALDGEVLSGRAGRDWMPLRGHPANGLDPEDGHRSVRSAVDGLCALSIAVEAQPSKASVLDRPLRHPAVRDVDLQEAAARHGGHGSHAVSQRYH